MASSWRKTKTRKVFQVAAVYVIVAWVIIKVVDVVLEPLSSPAWLDSFAIVLLIAGFPVALGLNWVLNTTTPPLAERDMATLHDLPLFADLEKTDHWPSYLGQMIDAEYIWVKKQQESLNLPSDLQPYFNTALSLWETAAIVAGNGKQHFAAYSLRAILERVALLWAAHPDVALDPITLVENFESSDRKIRTAASNDVFDAAKDKDKILVELYGILSRYFGHVSHLDRVPINFEDPKDKLLATRARIIPLLLLFDVGHCVSTLVLELLTVQGETPPPIVSGRNKKVDPNKFIRLAAYVMCERHTVKHGVNFGCLYKNIKDIVGDIGITNIYQARQQPRCSDPRRCGRRRAARLRSAAARIPDVAG